MTGFALLIALMPGLPPTPEVGEESPSLARTASGSISVTGLGPARIARLEGLGPEDTGWSEVLSLKLFGARREAQPIVGRYELDGTTLRFTPRFPLQAGTAYEALLRGGESDLRWIIRTPPTPVGPPTSVVAVDPSADVVPENLLKLYLRFSGSMSRGEAYGRVRILDDEGKPIHRPFLEIAEELWDTDQTRLTLLLDPGRIKRGLKPREEEGPILESGKSYTLVIDREWPDAQGRPLSEGYRKAFRAGPMDQTQPDPSQWTVDRRPQPGTRKALAIGFPEPLDRAMLARSIAVWVMGQPVAGRVEVIDGERGWRFVPDAPWAAGPMDLHVFTELEDLAGNSVGRPFEVKPGGPAARQGPRFVTVVVPTGP